MNIMEKMDAMVGVLECLRVTRDKLEPGFIESAITQYLLSQNYSPDEIKNLLWEWKTRADENWIPAEEDELDEFEGPCFECGEIINYREDIPCWNCNTI